MGKIATALTILLVAFGVAAAEEFRGVIKKVDGNSITVQKRLKKKQTEDVTLTAADNVKVIKLKLNAETKKLEAGDTLEGGLKNAAIKEGALVRITTDGSKVTEIGVGGGRGKGKKKKSAAE